MTKKEPYKRHGIKCQKCGERIWIECRVYDGKKEIKDGGNIPNNVYVKFGINTKQNKQLDSIRFDIRYPSEYFINYYLKNERKKMIRRIYGNAKRNFKEKMILCNKCIKIEALKE